MTDQQDRPVSFEEALLNPELYGLTADDIARIKRLQIGLRGWDIPQNAGPKSGWQSQFLLNKSKEPIGHMANVALVLSNNECWLDANGKPILAWNSFRSQMVWRAIPPWATAYAGRHVKEWSDEDADRLCTWLALKYQIKATPATCYSAARLIAQANHFHPIRDMLLRLPTWDNVSRLSSWLVDYLGATTRAADAQYLVDVGTWSLVSLVARAMEAGCKVDTMLILEGMQGKGKSQILEILAGSTEFLFILQHLELGSTPSLERLRGKWVVEMSELDSLSRTEANAAKAFITTATDTYRVAYGRDAKDFERQCVFFGTTNRSTYLQDETGGRRYWPVHCTKIDIEGFRSNRDQLLAEALYLYAKMSVGVSEKKWWPKSDEEIGRCLQEQEARRIADPWEEIITSYLDRDNTKRVTITQLLTEALKIPEGRQTRSDSTRTGIILQRLGWGISGRIERTGPRYYTPLTLDPAPTSPQRLDHATDRNDSESPF